MFKSLLTLTLLACGVVSAQLAVGQQVLFKRYIQGTGVIGGQEISTDDAEEITEGIGGTPMIDDLEDDDLDAGWEGEADDQNLVSVGLRFRDMFIPKGATIDSAFLILASHEDKDATDVAKLTIYGEAADFAETFNDSIPFTTRPATTAAVEWTVDEPWVIYLPYQTPDIGSVVQEIIDRPGWAVGNPISLIITGEDQGVTDTLENAREFEAFENIADPADGGDGRRHPERIPQLLVYYTAPGHFGRFILTTGTDPSGLLSVSSDDAEQENDAIDDLEDDDIDAGWEGEADDQNLLTAGMRFREIGVPQGAKIDSAFIYVSSHEDKDATDVAELSIKIEAADSAATFNDSTLITDRPVADSLDWIVAEPWFIYAEYRTPDVGGLIQTIIDRPGWKSGNALAFIFEGRDQGLTDTLENAREWEAFENIADPEDGGDGRNHPERIARLTIYFSGATSIEVPITFSALRVYPNPTTSGRITVEMTSAKPATAKIFQIDGRLVSEQTSVGGKQFDLDVRTLPTGNYYLQVWQDDQVYTEKIAIN